MEILGKGMEGSTMYKKISYIVPARKLYDTPLAVIANEAGVKQS